ncbi:MAG TPA: hypothetical protein VG602_01180 [Actinomycetota bacterium]|nr:hypothetical protein [Actinomycetota bacterium]
MPAKRRRTRWFIAGLTSLALLGPQTPASATTSYDQPVNFQWESAVLDVLIVPPEHGQIYNDNGPLGGEGVNELDPYQNSYLRAVERSVADWDRAVETFGPSWLQAGLVTNVYVLGRDNTPQSALTDPEIIITTDQNKGFILGVATWSRLNTESRCIVDNSKFFIKSFSYEDMYNVNGQEYGHCLGLGHVDGTPRDEIITHDVMHGTYYDPVGGAGTHRHCISNLNVRGLELVYGPLFGQPGGPGVRIDSTVYERMSC